LKIFRKFALFFGIFAMLLQVPPTVGAAFTVDDEKKLGRELYDRLVKENQLITDEKASLYLNRLGNLVLAKSSSVLFNFHFSIVNSSAINAFATPGGYVYVNKGLINLVDSEAELAGVLAHEIAHVNARHIANRIEKSKKLNFASLAAILAGAFLGGGTGTEAVLGLTMATTSTLSLRYSREDEEEADRLGMLYLVGAGYDGNAMLTFLKQMKNFEFYSNSVPSYFLTHPGTDDRINYLDGLLKVRYGSGGAEAIIGGLGRIQTLLLLEDKNLDSTMKYFRNRLEKNPADADALYGLAVTQGKLGKTSESYTAFTDALELSPDDPDILRDLGNAYLSAGKTSDAISVLRRAYEINTTDKAVTFSLGKAYETAGNHRTALEFYKKYHNRNASDLNILYHIAMAYGRIGSQANSHYFFGLYFKNMNKTESALFHFKEADKYAEPESDLAKDVRREMESLLKPRKKS
jgi:predicted Zn-dependent protease